jgi:hypothetical protein
MEGLGVPPEGFVRVSLGLGYARHSCY